MNIVYNELSKYKKHKAKQLARDLLETTQPSKTAETIALSKSIRESMKIDIMDITTLLATPVCGDRKGNWWWSVVYQNDSGIYEWGPSERSPVHSREAAVDDLRRLIAKLKRIQITKARDADNRDRLSVLLIMDKQDNVRCFVRQLSQWMRETSAFLKRLGIEREDFRDKNCGLFALRTARSIVLRYADEFQTRDPFGPRLIVDASRNETDIWNEAASFLMSCDIISVSERRNSTKQFEEVSRWFVSTIAEGHCAAA